MVKPKIRPQPLSGGNFTYFLTTLVNHLTDWLTEVLPYPHHVFTLKAPVELCIARDRARTKTLGEDTARAVWNLVSRFDYGTVIDASGSLEETLSQILSIV